MSVIEITSKPQFDALLESTPYVALQAHAVWCGPCKAISPFFARHAAALAVPATYVFARFDSDDVPDLAFELGVRALPAFYWFENGSKVAQVGGANPPALQKTAKLYGDKAKAAAADAAAAPAAPAAPAEAPAPAGTKAEEPKKDEPVVSFPFLAARCHPATTTTTPKV